MVVVHEELVVRVVAVRPWGVEVVTYGGERGTVDVTKHPGLIGEGTPPQEGDSLTVVVLDDEREPFRASALADDAEIARRLREQ